MITEQLVRLTIAYIGDGFHGWQSQKDGSSIQDAVESALAIIYKGPIRVTSASRTDTGVHAEFQVVTFTLHGAFNSYKLVKSLNSMLPKGVRVRDAEVVGKDFHPILSSKAKIYRYNIWRSVGITPFVEPFVWHLHRPLDIASMKRAAADMEGTKDFTSFCAADSSAKTKTRRVLEVRIIEKGPLIEVWVLGEGFLKQMIRIMVGTLVAVGQGKLADDCVPGILAAKDRRAAPSTAPAQGLSLVRIYYDNVPQLDALLEETIQGYNFGLGGGWLNP
jgi:tRNA pseudouridine38-40 synthase